MKFALGGVVLLALAIGIYAVLDHLIVTDRELIEKFADDVTGPVEPGYVDKAWSYLDLQRAPLDFRLAMLEVNQAGVYDVSNQEELKICSAGISVVSTAIRCGDCRSASRSKARRRTFP